MMAAILCVLSPIGFPVGPIPWTLQTFAVALSGFALGASDGSLAVAAYLLIGAAGAPVFGGMSAGIARFVGPTGGFLLAFPATAAICGSGAGRGGMVRAAASLAAMIPLYALGCAQLGFATGIPFAEALKVGAAPFAAKDVASALLAAYASSGVRRALGYAAGKRAAERP